MLAASTSAASLLLLTSAASLLQVAPTGSVAAPISSSSHWCSNLYIHPPVATNGKPNAPTTGAKHLQACPSHLRFCIALSMFIPYCLAYFLIFIIYK